MKISKIPLYSLLPSLYSLLPTFALQANPRWAIPADSPGSELLQQYFETETAQLEANSLSSIHTKEDWLRERPQRLAKMKQMLGIPDLAEKPPLNATITGTEQSDGFIVEKLHYQSLPGLYVTGNLYLPKDLPNGKKLPAILYVCGHGRVKIDGVNMGNKTHYQHHGAWFARNGYACLTIDTIQLGEIEGYHHGTYSGKMPWWMSKGYTPAGVEAWNSMRGIDYLVSRPEIDPARIGMTGRSGGGSYSWWTSVIDDRINVSVPVAGITSLRDHVIHGCVEGHCDCMFAVNTARWDFGDVAALVAPRKLLISNTDNDSIFPLNGVVHTYNKARRIYGLLGVPTNIGLHITEGPHSDTQPLRQGAFHWFNKHLKGETGLVSTQATKYFEPTELKVFDQVPKDERTSTIHDTFVPPTPSPVVPIDAKTWEQRRDNLLQNLRQNTFAGWPAENSIAADLKTHSQAAHEGVRLRQYTFTAQEPYQLPLFLLHRDGLEIKDIDLVVLNVLDEIGWKDFLAWASTGFSKPLNNYAPDFSPADKDGWELQKKMFQNFKWGMAYIAPRGIGPTRYTDKPGSPKDIQIRRRFYLLGQTLEGMQTWDTRQAIHALRQIPGLDKTQTWFQAEGLTAGIALYAALYEPGIHRLDLHNLPTSHMAGPHFLQILRYTDIPEAVAHAATSSQVRIYHKGQSHDWDFAAQTGKALGWDEKQFKVVSQEGEH